MLIRHEAEIASIENTLNSANINQETNRYSIVDTVSLPKTGSQYRYAGSDVWDRVQNLVVNGDFRNGTTGWVEL